MDEHTDPPEISALDGGIRYTMTEAARIKGVSYHTVSRAVRSGKLPAQRLGRMALIAATDLHAWRPMRERAPRKYRRDDNGSVPDDPVPAPLPASAGSYLDRLLIASDQLLAVASAESTAGFGAWLARWLSYNFQLDRVVIFKLDETHGRGVLFGAHGVEHADLPAVVEGTGMQVLKRLADRDAIGTLERRLADRLGVTEWFGDLDGGRPLFMPLRSGARCVGCAVVARTGHRSPLSPEDQAFAQRLALQAAFAMEHIELRDLNRTSMVASESILQELPIQLIAFDATGSVVYANQAFTDMWGEEFIARYLGRHYSHLLRSYRVETFDGVEVRLEDHPITAALRGERVDDTLLLVPDAPLEPRAFQTHALPTRDEEGAQTGVILSLREVTEAFPQTTEGDRSPLEMLADARRRVEMLATLSTEIAQRRVSEDIYELIVTRSCEILGADASFVTLPDRDNQVVVRATHNMPEGHHGRRYNRFALPVWLMVMANRDLAYVGEDEASAAGRKLLEDIGSRVALLVPLLDGDEALGVLSLHYRDVDALRGVDPELALAVGRQCGNAIKLHTVVMELEESRRRLLTTLDQLPQAVVILDAPDGDVVAINREAQALWGPVDEWLGRHASDIPMLDEQGATAPPERHPFLRPLRSQTTELGVPLITRNAAGEHVDVVANIAPVVGRRGDLRGAVAVLQRREHFKPIDQAKDEFISVVAHELRNPLTSLRGNLQMLERRLRRMDTDAAEREVSRVEGVIEQVDRIGDLVGRMLDVSRADLGKLVISPSPLDAVELVRGAIGDFDSQLEGRRIRLDAPEQLPVEWDGIRVQQVLTNLLTNAVRYAPEGDIDVTIRQREDDSVAIAVRDRGPGVPLRLRRRLFRLYYRFDDGEESADQAAMRHRGLGIGLYISARLARAHGGDLSVDNADDGGAVFTMTLPRVAAPEG